MKVGKKQSCHNYKCKRDRNLRSCFAHSIFSQFKEKENFKLNNSMSEKILERTKIINNFRKKKTEINNVNAEISQKFSISSILYLFFNANLLKLCEQLKRKTTFIKFLNDLNVLICSTNTKKNCKTLKKLYEVFKT